MKKLKDEIIKAQADVIKAYKKELKAKDEYIKTLQYSLQCQKDVSDAYRVLVGLMGIRV